MAIRINPTSLTEAQAKILFDFFEYQSTQENRKFWLSGTRYKCPDGTDLMFVHDVVQRKRKNDNGVRYEFISDNLLGRGSYGDVYEVAGTLAIEENSYKYKPAGSHKNKTRVVKIQFGQQTPVPVVMAEFNNTRLAGHLAVKEPVVTDDDNTLFVMKKIKGQELIKIIDGDLDNTNPLTTQQRLDISKALLQALKTQVTDKGLIHRDIKPQNIYIDLNAPITVTIFDYGFSIEKDKPDGQTPGTLAYAAPEIFNYAEQTVKTDVFSMARTILRLWMVDLESYDFDNWGKSAAYSQNIKLSTLTPRITDLDKTDENIIISTLQRMLLRIIDQRFSVEQAIAEFNKVQYSNKSNSINGTQNIQQSSSVVNDLSSISTTQQQVSGSNISQCTQSGGNGTPYQTSKTEELAILLGDDTINGTQNIQQSSSVVNDLSSISTTQQQVSNSNISQCTQSGDNGTHNKASKIAELAILLDDGTINPANAIDKTVKESKTRIDAILKKLEYIETNKVANLKERKEGDTALFLQNLTQELSDRLKNLKNQSQEEYCKNVLKTIKDCQELIEPTKGKFKQPRDNNYIWANIGLALAGLVVLYLAAVAINRYRTGQYLFFSPPKTFTMVNNIDNSLSELSTELTGTAGIVTPSPG